LATLFLGLFVLFLEPAETLLSNFLRIEQPTVHEVEDGDWLSKIALKYYGIQPSGKSWNSSIVSPKATWFFRVRMSLYQVSRSFNKLETPKS